MTIDQTYQKLCAELQRIDRLQAVSGILSWDEQVNLPAGSAAFRGQTHAAYAALLHREQTSPKIDQWLQTLEAADSLSSDQQVVVRVARKNFDRLAKLPEEFIQRREIARSRSFHAWQKARQNDDFNAFAPHLEEQISLSREYAALAAKGQNAYDFLIDTFDPGMDAASIEALFVPLEAQLKQLVQKFAASPKQVPDGILKGFPEDKQEAFLREVLKSLGFNFAQGRLDRAIHPFCGGHPEDTRMTTRYDVNNPLDSLSSSMHECGHALYQQGLDTSAAGTALGEPAGMAAHESQSRLWENQVGRSRSFWSFWEPRYRAAFPEQLASIDSETLFRAINRVAITPIRVDADEVTYNLHILLRFDLEKRLLDGSLQARDLPAAWNETSARILGYTPRNNREGCLQDVHWCEGYFGYFPSYTLGNLLAAQLWYAVRADIPELDEQIARAEFAPLLEWMRAKIHRQGMRFQTRALARQATGKDLGIDDLLRYLDERYGSLYG